jgi:hypothetical protein
VQATTPSGVAVVGATTQPSTLGLALGSIIGAVGIGMLLFEVEPIRRRLSKTAVVRRVEELLYGTLGSILGTAATSSLIQAIAV